MPGTDAPLARAYIQPPPHSIDRRGRAELKGYLTAKRWIAGNVYVLISVYPYMYALSLPHPQDPVGLNASAGGRHTGRSARGAGAGRTMALAGALAWADLWICQIRETRPQAAGGGATDSSSSGSRRAQGRHRGRRRKQQGAYCGRLAAIKSEKAHRQRGYSSAQSPQVRFATSSGNKLRLSPPQRN